MTKEKLLIIKVSKSWKQILKFSLEPKNERKYFCISALASKKNPKKWLKQKIKAQKDYFDAIYHNKVLIFLIRPPLEARAKIQKYFRSFFGSNENFKICFRDLLTFRQVAVVLKVS